MKSVNGSDKDFAFFECLGVVGRCPDAILSDCRAVMEYKIAN